MDLWHLILFVAASLFALRSFVALTNHHQRFALQRLLKEREARLQNEPARDTTKSTKAVA